MIVAKSLTRPENEAQSEPPAKLEAVPDQGASMGFSSGGRITKARQVVSPETAKTVSTFYRGANILSDDVAAMPLHQFRKVEGKIERILPDAALRNTAYLLELAPNRWMSPFILKKTVVMWLIYWGNALIWAPLSSQRELFILPANASRPLLSPEGDMWFQVTFPNGKIKYIPAVEVLHLMVNSTNGLWGRSVLEYARETIGRQLGAYETQSQIQGKGLNPAAYISVEGELKTKEERQKVRDAYSEAITGPENAAQLAVFDKRVVKFEPITMKLTDAQFLESIGATDRDIANFLGMPEYKLNMGKQSYESNAQHDLDYLKTTLDPTYLVQWEQAARLKWLDERDQMFSYFKFIRESILRTDAKTRAELHEVQIRTGILKPNEAREHEDRDSYPDGEKYWMTSNNAEIGAEVHATT